MFRKSILIFILISSSLFSMSASTVQKADKEVLGCIKGLGERKIQLIINFRTKQTITSLDELLEIKGIGKATVKNIRNDIKKKTCTKINKNTSKKQKKQKHIKAISAK